MPRDFSKPYTEEEVEGLKEVFCRLPTYKAGIGITTKDFAALIQAMEYPRTPEQFQAYVSYYEEACGGVLSLANFLDNLRSLHKTSSFAREMATHCFKFDGNGRGEASAERFEKLMAMITAHDPTLPKKSYQEFAKEADVNEDGEISIDECVEWIEKNSSK